MATTDQHDHTAILANLERIATDVGRLRRRLPEGSPDQHALDRISNAVQTIDAVLQPTAADLYRSNFRISGDHELSLAEALHTTDRRAHRLRELLDDTEEARTQRDHARDAQVAA